MAVEIEQKNIYSGTDSNVTLAQAQKYNIVTRRRNIIAAHLVPDGGALEGALEIWGSVRDDNAWYVKLGEIDLATASETTKHYYIEDNYRGIVLRYLKFVVSGIANGAIDADLLSAEA